MSKASASTTLVLIPDLGTVNPYLLCDKGDLRQDFEGSPSAPSKIVPDYTVAAEQPTVSFVATSSRASVETPDEITFKIGAATIGTITRSGSSYTKSVVEATAGPSNDRTFVLLDPTENGGYYGLKIIKNLVDFTAGASTLITAVATIGSGTAAADVTCSIPYNAALVTSNSIRTVIEAGDANNFKISDNNLSCILKARHFAGTAELTANKSFRWFAMNFNAGAGKLSGWEKITGATTNTLTVTEAMVDSSQKFMVAVYNNTADADDAFIDQDTQLVIDTHDLFEIDIVRTPADGQVSSKVSKIEIDCQVFRRKNNTPITLSNPRWNFLGVTPAGTSVFKDPSTGSKTTGHTEVSRQHVENAGGQLELFVGVEFD